ncbi:MAG: hypothetical protein AAGI22_00285 [Planctomycetota bacterium]
MAIALPCDAAQDGEQRPGGSEVSTTSLEVPIVDSSAVPTTAPDDWSLAIPIFEWSGSDEGTDRWHRQSLDSTPAPLPPDLTGLAERARVRAAVTCPLPRLRRAGADGVLLVASWTADERHRPNSLELVPVSEASRLLQGERARADGDLRFEVVALIRISNR